MPAVKTEAELLLCLELLQSLAPDCTELVVGFYIRLSGSNLLTLPDIASDCLCYDSHAPNKLLPISSSCHGFEILRADKPEDGRGLRP